MKHLLIIFLVSVGLFLGSQTEAADFQWSQGQPTTVDDQADTTYYGWSAGQPTVMYQYQAPAAPTGEVTPKPEIWWE
jgi:hypothetical protein